MRKIKQILVAMPVVVLSACGGGDSKAAKMGISEEALDALQTVKSVEVSKLKESDKKHWDELAKKINTSDFEIFQCYWYAIRQPKEICIEEKKKCRDKKTTPMSASDVTKALEKFPVRDPLKFHKNVGEMKKSYEAMECADEKKQEEVQKSFSNSAFQTVFDIGTACLRSKEGNGATGEGHGEAPSHRPQQQPWKAYDNPMNPQIQMGSADQGPQRKNGDMPPQFDQRNPPTMMMGKGMNDPKNSGVGYGQPQKPTQYNHPPQMMGAPQPVLNFGFEQNPQQFPTEYGKGGGYPGAPQFPAGIGGYPNKDIQY